MSFIHGIAASTSAPQPLLAALGDGHADMLPEMRDWIADPARQGMVAMLESDGFDAFAPSESDVAELARQAITASLELSGARAADVDATIFATESFWDGPAGFEEDPFRHFALRNRFLQVMTEVGMVNATPYGNWLSACANLGTSLILARAMVSSGAHRKVMVVMADRNNRRLPRLMHNGASVVSDVATSCLVDGQEGALEVTSIATASAPKMATFNLEDRADLGKIVLETVRALKRLRATFVERTGRTPGDFETVIAGHFHSMSIQVVTDALGIRPEAVRRDARREFGHAHASDNLLTLRKLQLGGTLNKGDEILLLNTGIWTWSLITVRIL